MLKKAHGKQKIGVHCIWINEASETTAHTYMQDIDIQLLKITGPQFLHSFDIFLIFFFCQLSVNTEYLCLGCDVRNHTKGSSKSRCGKTNSIIRLPWCQTFMAPTEGEVSFSELTSRFQALFPNTIIFCFHNLHNIIE